MDLPPPTGSVRTCGSFVTLMVAYTSYTVKRRPKPLLHFCRCADANRMHAGQPSCVPLAPAALRVCNSLHAKSRPCGRLLGDFERWRNVGFAPRSIALPLIPYQWLACGAIMPVCWAPQYPGSLPRHRPPPDGHESGAVRTPSVCPRRPCPAHGWESNLLPAHSRLPTSQIPPLSGRTTATPASYAASFSSFPA